MEKYDLPVRLTDSLPLEELLAAARKDKKARAGKLRYVAMKSLGKAVTRENISEDRIQKLWLSAGAVE